MTKATPTKDEPVSRADLLERLQLVLLADAQRGLEDIAAGRVEDADEALARIQAGRTH
jgi:predicted transcriptional regulator